MTRQSNIDRRGIGSTVMAMHKDSTPTAIAATVGHGITPSQVSRYITKNTPTIDENALKMVVAAISGIPTVRDTETEGTEYYGKFVVDVANPFSKYYAIARSGMSAQVSRAFISLSLKLTDGMTLVGDERHQDALDQLMVDLDFSALSQDIARSMCEMGTVVVLLRDEGASEAADRVEEAVDEALRAGMRTPDVGGARTTDEVGAWIAHRVEAG